jgi:isoamylase
VDGPGDIGRLLSWRGLDNATYYELTPDHTITDHHHLLEQQWCRRHVDTASPVVRQEIMDALTYWKDALGVDGFRFDLAPVLGNTFTEGRRFQQQRLERHHLATQRCSGSRRRLLAYLNT